MQEIKKKTNSITGKYFGTLSYTHIEFNKQIDQ